MVEPWILLVTSFPFHTCLYNSATPSSWRRPRCISTFACIAVQHQCHLPILQLLYNMHANPFIWGFQVWQVCNASTITMLRLDWSYLELVITSILRHMTTLLTSLLHTTYDDPWLDVFFMYVKSKFRDMMKLMCFYLKCTESLKDMPTSRIMIGKQLRG